MGQPPPLPGQGPSTDVSVCDDGYFRALRVPLLRGRVFSEREMREKTNVVVINDALARRYFPNEDPLGKSLVIAMNDPNVPTEIIGVIGNGSSPTSTEAAKLLAAPVAAYSAMTRRCGPPDPAVFAPSNAKSAR